jgi:hypothetical protein
MKNTLGSATLSALQSGFDLFNPRLEIKGQIQPVILGMPLGEPDEGVSLVIDKGGVGFGLRVSPLVGWAEKMSLVTPVGMTGPLLTKMLTAGFKDYLEKRLNKKEIAQIKEQAET